MGKSIYEEYSNFTKNVIDLAIKTMPIEDKALIRKKYGDKYDGKGFLYNSEIGPFESAKKRFEKRILEVDELIKAKKTSEEIISMFQNKRQISYFQKYNQPKPVLLPKVSKKKRKELTFLDYFPDEMQHLVISHLNKNDILVLEYFYTGKDYNICIEYNENEQMEKDLLSIVARIKKEIYISMNNQKKKQNKENENLILGTFPLEEREKIFQIISQFENQMPVYYSVIMKGYTGENLTIPKTRLKKEDKVDLDNAIKRITYILKQSEIILSTSVDNEEKTINNSKTESIRKQKNLLDYFPDIEKEQVVELVKLLKTKNINYYNIIIKKYSGEYFEIINPVILDNKEWTRLYHAIKRLKQLAENQESEKYRFKTLQEIYPDYALEEIVKAVSILEQLYPNYYRIVCKRYGGDQFKKVLLEPFTFEEKKTFDNAKQILGRILKKKGNYTYRGVTPFFDLFPNCTKEQILSVMPIVKEKYPRHYAILCKRYSGDNFEIINNIRLSEKENQKIAYLKIVILKLLFPNEKPEIVPHTKPLLKCFPNYSEELVLSVISSLKEKNPNYYDIITKIYSGDKFEIINNVKLSETEKIIFNNAKQKIKTLLAKHEIVNIASLMDYFSDYNPEQVLFVIKILKENNIDDYNILLKKYVDETFTVCSYIELTVEEQKRFCSIVLKLKEMLKYNNIENTNKVNDIVSEEEINDIKNNFKAKRKPLLEYFLAEDKNLILQIIEDLKTTNPSYYEIIQKAYTGNEYEIVTDVTLSKQEAKILNNAKACIASRIEKLKSKSYSILDLLKYKPNTIVNDTFFSIIEQCHNMINKDLIIDSYIRNLNYFSLDDAVEIIRLIAIISPKNILDIINSSYFIDKMNYLTEKEQQYIYLKLLSLSNSNLTLSTISKILNIEQEYLEQYEITTQYDEVNVLNKLLKK